MRGSPPLAAFLRTAFPSRLPVLAAASAARLEARPTRTPPGSNGLDSILGLHGPAPAAPRSDSPAIPELPFAVPRRAPARHSMCPIIRRTMMCCQSCSPETPGGRTDFQYAVKLVCGVLTGGDR